jgi:hypothetical protein
MARLIVNAIAKDVSATTRGYHSNYILVSITDEDGFPVTGLKAANFRVALMTEDFDGASVDITNVTASNMPGFYFINVVPVRMKTLKPGTYTFAIATKHGEDRGQTLATVAVEPQLVSSSKNSASH